MKTTLHPGSFAAENTAHLTVNEVPQAVRKGGGEPNHRFDWRDALARAEATFALPPKIERIVRPVPRGEVVQRFVLPLALCPTTNRTRHTKPGQQARTKRLILGLLQVQAKVQRFRKTLPGRPQVLCCRFSSTEPDAYSDWAKLAVDLLCVPAGRRKTGLGLLRDDRPADAEVVQWWESAKAKEGFVWIEVRA